MERGKVLRRQVSRLPAGVVLRLDALAALAGAASGKPVSRAAVLRAVLDAGLESAEDSVDFAVKVGCAVIKRGRKAGMPVKPPTASPPNDDKL
jgi:AAA+ superfamily predicted ATPase